MKHPILFLCTLVFTGVLLMSCSDDDGVTPGGRVLTESVRARLEAAADSVFAEGRTPGMIALFSVEGEPDFIISRGVSNIDTNEPIRPQNAFRIASNTKTFTGTAVLILADKGLIDLNKTIDSYLPEYHVPNGDKITIRMLGNMTSGLYNYTDDVTLWSELQAGNFIRYFSPDTLLAMAFRHPVNFAPGTEYGYSNTNTVLLGLLLEKLCRKPVGSVIEEYVLRPLNLRDTYWGGQYFLTDQYTHGYNSDYGPLLDATNWNPSIGYSAGQLVSTLQDLKVWSRCLAEGALLSDAMKAERFTWVKNHYGFCVMKAGSWIGHSGSIPGYTSHVLYNQSKKMALIICTNLDTGAPMEYFSDAFRIVLGN